MPHVLLLEDDAALADLFAFMLRREGYSVAHAANGVAGLDLLRLRAPDAILTDIVMPEMDGLTFLRHARILLPETPIVAMSGGLASSADKLVAAREAGACWTLQKPFALEDLGSAMRFALSLARSPAPVQGLLAAV